MALTDVFKRFKEDGGAFKGDVRGILSLYEASHVRAHGDIILDEAAKFTTAYLKSVGNEIKSPLAGQVALALHQCFHKGMNRVEARRHVTLIDQDPSRNKTLLRFAKLDFNLLQLLHQEELSDIARWWKALHSKIPFARDRSVEAYFWAVGIYHEPKYSIAQKIFAKLVLIIQLLDDTYDAFASIQSLEPLTHAIDRWEYSCMDSLPDDVKVCCQVLLQTFDEFEHDLAEQGRSFHVNYAKQQMKRNNKAWWQEAKWCHEKCISSYDEYMQAALVSIGHVEAIIGSYLGMESTATKEVFEWVCQNPNPKLIKASNFIFRLMNDIGGYKHEQSSRDHVASSVECYMKQHGIEDEKQTIEELERQVEHAWKDVNQAMLRPFEVPKPCLDRPINLVRAADVMYKGRTDGYTMVNENIMKTIAAVLVHAIPL